MARLVRAGRTQGPVAFLGLGAGMCAAEERLACC